MSVMLLICSCADEQSDTGAALAFEVTGESASESTASSSTVGGTGITRTLSERVSESSGATATAGTGTTRTATGTTGTTETTDTGYNDGSPAG